ncbi:hypothetical protein LINPERHAP1_LOCUS22717 [Linum perenne]
MLNWHLVFPIGSILLIWLSPVTISLGLNPCPAGPLLLNGIRDRKAGLQLILMDRLFNLRATHLLVVSSAIISVIAP